MKTYNQVPEEKKEIILSYIKKKMEKQGYGTNDLAECLNLGKSTMWRYLKGITEMPLMTYLDICSMLKINPTKPIKKAYR